jgi:hypothetical protein
VCYAFILNEENSIKAKNSPGPMKVRVFCFKTLIKMETIEQYRKKVEEKFPNNPKMVNKLVKAKIEHRKEKQKDLETVRKTEEELAKKIIPKEQLQDGVVYEGDPTFARDADRAMWDAKEGMFMYMRYKFGWRKDWMDYFGDVVHERIAGFAPLKVADEQVLLIDGG